VNEGLELKQLKSEEKDKLLNEANNTINISNQAAVLAAD
jgi:hypothetical protein|tara:strand:+ start:938 stop:1054 length:117 start_codon:yes stop_codon:yes gene_type:complete